MGRIQPLPSHLIDQIAAGEVVERPASVVKELVENALDAGAKRIRIEVRDGGCAWICISDDGYGMSPADATLALQRHATSKIATVDDLSDIHTFGFRGEALPSIASVSNFRLRTREAAAEAGFEIVVEAGEIKEERACAATPGTRIEVADLFASIPARRKFLKRAATEWGHIVDWLVRVALVHPDVHFELRREQKKPLIWPATPDPLARVATVLSEDEASALVPVDGCEGELRLSGFASAPAFHRATAAGVYLFVNGRPVRTACCATPCCRFIETCCRAVVFPRFCSFSRFPPMRWTSTCTRLNGRCASPTPKPCISCFDTPCAIACRDGIIYRRHQKRRLWEATAPSSPPGEIASLSPLPPTGCLRRKDAQERTKLL